MTVSTPHRSLDTHANTHLNSWPDLTHRNLTTTSTLNPQPLTLNPRRLAEARECGDQDSRGGADAEPRVQVRACAGQEARPGHGRRLPGHRGGVLSTQSKHLNGNTGTFATLDWDAQLEPARPGCTQDQLVKLPCFVFSDFCAIHSGGRVLPRVLARGFR